MIDGLVAHRLRGDACCANSRWLVAAGVVVYLLRVGWRLRLYAAAYRLGVELRAAPLRAPVAAGPAFYQTSRTGDLMALATNDIDAVEMAAGEAMLAGFDGTLTLVLVVGDDVAGRRLAPGRCRAAALPADGAGVLVDLAPRARSLAAVAGALRRT